MGKGQDFHCPVDVPWFPVNLIKKYPLILTCSQGTLTNPNHEEIGALQTAANDKADLK